MIKKITLKNWKSHLNSELEFSLGTNALIGILGSGKTSVLDAICFALFGTFPTLQSKKIKLDDIIMKKPIEQSKAEVKLIFEKDGNEYCIKRVIEKRKGTTYSEIRENDELIEAPSSSRVTKIVEKILKVNYDLFTKAIYSEQNALDYFLMIPKGKRMKKIDELLMIDKFEKARASVVKLINKLLDRKAGIQSAIEQIDIEEIKKAIEDGRKELEKIRKEKESFKTILEKTKKEKSILEKEVKELRKVNEELEKEIREAKAIEGKLNENLINLKNLESEIKGVNRKEVEEKLKELDKNKKSLEKKIEEKRKVYEKKQKESSEYKARMEFLKSEKIDKLEREIKEKTKIKEEYDNLIKTFGEDVEEELKVKEANLEKINIELEGVKTKIKDFEGILEQLSSIEGKCPLCESKLTAKKRKALIKQKKKQIEALKEDLRRMIENKKSIEEDIKKLKDVVEEISNLFQEIKDLDIKKRELENSKTSFLKLSELVIKTDNEIGKISNEIKEIESEIKILENKEKELILILYKFQDYENTQKRIRELINERKEKADKIDKIKKMLEGRDLETKENLLKEVIGKEKEIEAKIYGLEELEKEKKSRIEEYEKSFNVFIKHIREIKRIEETVKQLKIFEVALKETQIELRREFVAAVNYSMSRLWQTLYPYQDFIDIKLAIEEGDYVLQLKERIGRWVNVEGVASGGERSIAALALRIAFALVLAPQLRWLVLDEPTHNLDAKAVEDLAITLREKIGEFIDQVFLITHDEKLEEAVTGNLYKLQRDKERDGATKVIRLQ